MTGQGADCNTTTSGGVPVLCLAAKNKHFGAFKALTAHGSDLHSAVNTYSLTLIFSCFRTV